MTGWAGTGIAVDTNGAITVNGSSGGGSSNTPPGMPLIANPIAILANTEYSYALPVNTQHFSIRARGNAKIQFAFTASQSNTNFITVFPGSIIGPMNIKVVAATLYFQSNKANEVIEILSWY